MKFKTIFFLFNFVILLSFLLVSLMPMAVLGMEYSRIFWKNNRLFILLFLAIISGTDFYFIRRWPFFSCLENEDWPGIFRWLEQKMFQEGKVSRGNIKLFVNAALSTARIDRVRDLGNLVKEKKPRLLGACGTILGLPYLLGNQDALEGREFFKASMEKGAGKELLWQQWCYALLCRKGGEAEEAAKVLEDLQNKVKEPVLRLLCLHSLRALGETLPGGFWEKEKAGFLKDFPARKTLEIRVGKLREHNLMVLLLSGFLEDALEQIYGSESDGQKAMETGTP